MCGGGAAVPPLSLLAWTLTPPDADTILGLREANMLGFISCVQYLLIMLAGSTQGMLLYIKQV